MTTVGPRLQQAILEWAPELHEITDRVGCIALAGESPYDAPLHVRGRNDGLWLLRTTQASVEQLALPSVELAPVGAIYGFFDHVEAIEIVEGASILTNPRSLEFLATIAEHARLERLSAIVPGKLAETKLSSLRPTRTPCLRSWLSR